MTLLDLDKFEKITDDDWRGPGFYDAVVTTALNIRNDTSTEAKVLDVLSAGDRIVIHMKNPGDAWARVVAINGRWVQAIYDANWMVMAEYLTGLVPRRYTSPDPTAVG